MPASTEETPAKKTRARKSTAKAKAPVEAKAPAVKAAKAKKEPVEVDPSLELAQRVAHVMLERKADDVTLLNVGDLTSFADFFVLCTVQSDRQVQAVSRSLAETLKSEGHPALSTEGQEQSHWVLMDFGGVVGHIFYEPARAYYDLDGLWADAPRVTVEDDAAQKKAAVRRKAAEAPVKTRKSKEA